MRLRIFERRDDDWDDSQPTPTAGFPSTESPTSIPTRQKYDTSTVTTTVETSTTTVTSGNYPTRPGPPFGWDASPTPYTDNYTLKFDANDGPEEQEVWGKFSQGVKAAVIIAGIFGVVAIVIASIWFCCGKPRRRRLKAEEDMQLHRERMDAEARGGGRGGSVPSLQVPLRTLSGNARRESIAPVQARGAVGRVASRLSRHVSLRSNGVDAPPRYEEVVPPAHQRLAGGMVRRGDQNQITPMEEEDGMGVVADGKTPLSEIPFEDVVLTPTRSQASGSGSGSASPSGSARDFDQRHAMGGGNTTGHTNA